MLRELFASLLTPATSHARQMGYVHEGIAIEARYRRCRAAWAEHIGVCHQVILAEMARCRRHDVAVVLGSGPLYDIPLAPLAETFGRLALIDVFHPPRARRQAARHANVTLVEHDLLGLDAGKAVPPPAGPSRWRKLVPDADFVVSANLLAQLPLLPAEFWARRHLAEQEIARRARALMAAHLADLALGGHPCLISEWRRRWFAADGRPDGEELPLAGLPLAPARTSWTWRLAPPGELPKGASLTLDVGLFDPLAGGL